MVDYVSKKSLRLLDFSEGSGLRTIFEAIAMELEEYYFKSYINMRYAMQNAVYDAFGFEKRPATYAHGDVTITFSSALLSDLVIKAGTRFSANHQYGETILFETKQDYLIKRGSLEATLVVHCLVAGTKGNVVENSISNMQNPISVVSKVTNKERFNTGLDEETDEERQNRFNKYVESRSKATNDAITYGTLEVQGVTGAWVDDSQTGIIYVYAHDEAGNLPDFMKAEIEKNLINYRPAGTPLFVLPINKVALNLTVNLTIRFEYDSEDFRAYIKGKIEDYLDSFVVSKDFILSDLNDFVRDIDKIGITNCIIKNPASDLEVLPSQLIRSGSVTLNFTVV